MLAALALTAMAPAAASARGGSGGGGHPAGSGHFSGGGGHFAGGGPVHYNAARAGGGGMNFGGVRVGGGAVHASAARYGGAGYSGARFAAVGPRVAPGGPYVGWRHGPYYRRFVGPGPAFAAGAYVGGGTGYCDAPYNGDEPNYGDESYYGDADYGNAPSESCVLVRQLVLTYYGPAWQLIPICYGY